MANPQPTDAHLRVAHSINEAIMLRDFTKRQRKVLDLILRLSWGCGKKIALIPRQRDFEIIGIAEGHIKAEIDWLIDSKVINTEDNQYSFNKNFDEWQVSRVKPFQPQKLTELVSLNLRETYQNSKLEPSELTKTVSRNLPKEEETTYQKSKFFTPELASPKEILKKGINSINRDILIRKIYQTIRKFLGHDPPSCFLTRLRLRSTENLAMIWEKLQGGNNDN